MAGPDDPQDAAAQFWAQILGYEISYDGPSPGSPLWGMQLVQSLATSPAMPAEEVSRVVKAYLGARWTYCYPELEEIWGERPHPVRTHDHPEVLKPVERAVKEERSSAARPDDAPTA
jgi:hypothetical protein